MAVCLSFVGFDSLVVLEAQKNPSFYKNMEPATKKIHLKAFRKGVSIISRWNGFSFKDETAKFSVRPMEETNFLKQRNIWALALMLTFVFWVTLGPSVFAANNVDAAFNPALCKVQTLIQYAKSTIVGLVGFGAILILLLVGLATGRVRWGILALMIAIMIIINRLDTILGFFTDLDRVMSLSC